MNTNIKTMNYEKKNFYYFNRMLWHFYLHRFHTLKLHQIGRLLLLKKEAM